MTMNWSCNKFVLYLLIGLLLNLYGNVFMGKRKTTVFANGNVQISGPFLQIEKRPFSKLSITESHLEHFLHCTANIEASFYERNRPTLFYTWYRNRYVLQSFCGRRNDFCIFDNGTLRLPPSEKAGGLYRCQVNANSIAVLSESVTVEYPVLKRVPAMANITVPSSLPLTLNCPVKSTPPANVTWYHDNVFLAKEPIEHRYVFLANGSLVLSVPKALDSGKYRCIAKNQFVTKNHRQFVWTLKVDEANSSANGSSMPSQLVPELQEATLYVPLSRDLKLQCRSLSGAVAVEWWFQRVPSAPVEKLSNNSIAYLIQNANVNQHEGYYTCSTANDKQTFHVVVTTAPAIVKQLPSYESHIAALITLSCHAVGNPTPEISWYHNAAPVNSSFLRYIASNELRLISFDSEEEGIYQCFARNVAGEASTDGEIRLKSMDPMGQLIPNPLKNIRCYAHSSTTINVTFDRVSLPLYFLSVHIVQSHPHRWTAIAPLEPIDSSYVVISSHLPAYRPFELITRAMLHTSNSQMGSYNSNEEPVTSSLRSQPITCCTQGLPLQIVTLLTNDTFVTWPQPDIKSQKYYILQFGSNHTRPPPHLLFARQLRGTTTRLELKEDDVTQKLTDVQALNETEAYAVLRRVDIRYADDDSREDLASDEDENIFNLVLPANVTGIILQKLALLKMRVLIITAENEDLRQDFRYVQWKIIENETSGVANVPFHLTKVESRMVAFLFQDSIKEQCVHVCYTQINNQEETMCVERKIIESFLEVRSLKPTSWYRLNLYSCQTKIFYGQKDFETLADPPGTISNQRVTKQNGLKLSWDPPIHPNGKIHHYNILWTINNVTHEANVFECGVCFYKFPHVSETSKINITVRVVGENGIGAPIFIDLRNINHQTLEVEHSPRSEVYSGIAIGAVLSALCIFFFALLIVCQRRRFKAHQQAPLDLISQSEVNFGNLSNVGIPCDSTGAISGGLLQHEYHEMQTLIPRSRPNVPFFDEHQLPLQECQMSATQKVANGNGNGVVRFKQEHDGQELRESAAVGGDFNQSQIPLCTSTPRPMGKLREATIALKSSTKPYFIPFKQLPLSAGGALPKPCSSPDFHSSVPTSLPLAAPPNISNGSRNGSATSSATANNCGTQRHFSKRSSWNDGICLLAEEESSATLTPTSEAEVSTVDAVLSNGYATCSLNSAITHSSSLVIWKESAAAAVNPVSISINIKPPIKIGDHRLSSPAGDLAVPMVTPSPAWSERSSSANLTFAIVKHWMPAANATTTHRRSNLDPNG